MEINKGQRHATWTFLKFDTEIWDPLPPPIQTPKITPENKANDSFPYLHNYDVKKLWREKNCKCMVASLQLPVLSSQLPLPMIGWDVARVLLPVTPPYRYVTPALLYICVLRATHEHNHLRAISIPHSASRRYRGPWPLNSTGRHGLFLKSTCDMEPIDTGKNISDMTWAIS